MDLDGYYVDKKKVKGGYAEKIMKCNSKYLTLSKWGFKLISPRNNKWPYTEFAVIDVYFWIMVMIKLNCLRMPSNFKWRDCANDIYDCIKKSVTALGVM